MEQGGNNRSPRRAAARVSFSSDDVVLGPPAQAPKHPFLRSWETPEYLAGMLSQRKAHNRYGWKRRYVVLNLGNGEISCFQPPTKESDTLTASRSNSPDGSLLEMDDGGSDRRGVGVTAKGENRKGSEVCSDPFAGLTTREAKLKIPANVCWTMVDVNNDESVFALEVPMDVASVTARGRSQSPRGNLLSRKIKPDASNCSDDEKREKVIRYFFKCPYRGNEKSLWLRAARRLDRLSSVSRTKLENSIRETFKRRSASRERTQSRKELAERTRALERQLTLRPSQYRQIPLVSLTGDEERNVGNDGAGEKEHMAVPTYAYLHRWMTEDELTQEMLKPSETFHDIRQEEVEGGSLGEIGTLNVEVLCCLGLPKFERFSKADAVCYLACGQHAFVTDVIPDRQNPFWLRKARRACVFPIFHAYAQLFVGVFNDNGKENDSFIGRVVVDVSRLRPGCTYDVTLPLRVSTNVYTRKGQGLVRLRFKLHWNNQQKAVLSYLPKKSDVQSALKRKLGEQAPAVTIKCSDMKAFRNIATTIHGKNMPGTFSQQAFRATIREFHLYRIMLLVTMKKTALDLAQYKNPALSLFVFFGWMHCVSSNSVALVPPYFVSLVFLFLMRNFVWAHSDLMTKGFAPLTFKEIVMAAMWGGAHPQMKPFEVEMRSHSSIQSASERKLQLGPEICPSASLLFRAFGFTDSDFQAVGDCDHMEFPFSNSERNPKMSLDDATVKRKKNQDSAATKPIMHIDLGYQKRQKMAQHYDDESYDWDEGSFEDVTKAKLQTYIPDVVEAGREVVHGAVQGTIRGCVRTVKTAKTGLDAGANVFSPLANGAVRSSLVSLGQAANKLAENDLLVNGPYKDGEQKKGPHEPSSHAIVLSRPQRHCEVGTKSLGDDSFPDSSAPAKAAEKKQPNNTRIPEQNADVLMQSKTPLTEELMIMKERIQDQTFRLFDDRLFIMNNDEPADVPDAKLRRELQKHIGMHPYSNPVRARIALYLGPLLSVMQIGLSANRAIFHLFVWKDPYLSSLVSLACVFLVVLLAMFPWRLFLLFIGIISVGPQNWFYRVFKKRLKFRTTPEEAKDLTDGCIGESTGGTKSRHMPTRRTWLRRLSNEKATKYARRKRKEFKSLQSTDFDDETSCASGGNSHLATEAKPSQNLFNSHMSLVNGSYQINGNENKCAGSSYQEVVVPYTPLKHNRFYDWPPDPSVSRVTIDP